eukprot:COSAG05_NODE_21055_length_275_cov_0.420455_1_plen_47_part_10
MVDRSTASSFIDLEARAALRMPLLFFKQKTAYEMESRDWSSDVCSSD